MTTTGPPGELASWTCRKASGRSECISILSTTARRRSSRSATGFAIGTPACGLDDLLRPAESDL